jgi:hypothetical protein
VLSRQLPNGTVACGALLVGRFCLGARDAFAEFRNQSEYDANRYRKTRRENGVRDLSPAATRELMAQALECARSLGWLPHRTASRMLDPAAMDEDFDEDGLSCNRKEKNWCRAPRERKEAPVKSNPRQGWKQHVNRLFTRG